MITPPMVTNTDDDTCPNCGQEEDIKMVCRKCNYEYPEDESHITWYDVVIFIVLLVLVIYAIGILLNWLADTDNRSLVQIVKDSWQWITSKKIY